MELGGYRGARSVGVRRSGQRSIHHCVVVPLRYGVITAYVYGEDRALVNSLYPGPRPFHYFGAFHSGRWRRET